MGGPDWSENLRTVNKWLMGGSAAGFAATVNRVIEAVRALKMSSKVGNALAGLVWFGVVLGSVVSVRGDIAYHFMPGIEGQERGFCQFLDVAPQFGPKDFTVQVSGALVGSDPSSDASTARAYLDKWGLGVLNPSAGRDVGIQNQVQIDGRHDGEYIRLAFQAPVQITLLTFASVGIGEGFDLLADGVLVDLAALFPGTSSIRQISLSQGNWPGTIDFSQATQPLGFATQWDVVVRGASVGDGIQLENVNVQHLPEPSTLILSSMGLAGLTFWGLRRGRRSKPA